MVYRFSQYEEKTALLIIPSSDPRVLKVREKWAGCQVMETAGERWFL